MTLKLPLSPNIFFNPNQYSCPHILNGLPSSPKGIMASITQSGRDLRIEGAVLRGILKNDAGEDVDASLDLNTILGNSDGEH
jgi:hypothetical protein